MSTGQVFVLGVIWLLLTAAAIWVVVVILKHRYSKTEESPEEQAEARAVDPDNPPRWMTYQPKGTRRHHCTCHQRELEPGERVLWWPIPESGGAVDLYCTETVQEASQ